MLAALLIAAPIAAEAGDVRPPPGADPTNGGTNRQMDLPGLTNIDAPEMNTTMKEKRKLRNQRKAVDKDTVKALRELAIEEFGQSSSGSE
jgi:hypothetical protein